VIARRLDLGEQAGRHDDRAAFVRERAQQEPDFRDPGRVQAVGGFVEQQELGVGRSPTTSSTSSTRVAFRPRRCASESRLACAVRFGANAGLSMSAPARVAISEPNRRVRPEVWMTALGGLSRGWAR